VSETHPDSVGERRLSIYGLANLFLRERRIMIALPLVAVITAAIITVLKKPQWVATSIIVAEGVQTSSPMSSIAEQFGVRMSSGGGTGSPDFYAQLLKSPEVLTPVASRSYSTTDAEGKRAAGFVSRLYGIEAPPGTDTIALSRDLLTQSVKSSSDPITGIISLSVTAPSRDLSIVLNREILASANNFLQNRRQARAAEETKFVESRLDEARSQLAVAEANLRDFVTQNRQYQTSPQLALQSAQLERTVSLRQQVFVTLSQAYEQARIEAMRNISLISVLQRPEYSVNRKVASLARNIVLALILGVLVAMGLVVARTKLAREPLENPADVEEFRALIKAAVPKPPGRRARKLQGGSAP
jgi:uncharacterized protein involved in exopolysaccharide biosynthesis